MPTKEFSLILATCGRLEEVDRFLRSVAAQDFDLSSVEVLIADQNRKGEVDLGPVVDRYRGILDIRRIVSPVRGLSHNRNAALRLAVGRLVAFPDDDCVYYSDTLRQAAEAFAACPGAGIVLGRIVDRGSGKKIIRNWSDRPFAVTLRNFFLNYSAVTIFCRRNDIQFDETLGIGAYFGSYEDADYIVQALKRNGQVRYRPEVEVWHPEPQGRFPDDKVYSYGLGFGGLCRKHLSPGFFLLWLQVLAYHALLLTISLIPPDRRRIRTRWLALHSRVLGFLRYSGSQQGRETR